AYAANDDYGGGRRRARRLSGIFSHPRAVRDNLIEQPPFCPGVLILLPPDFFFAPPILAPPSGVGCALDRASRRGCCCHWCRRCDRERYGGRLLGNWIRSMAVVRGSGLPRIEHFPFFRGLLLASALEPLEVSRRQ